MIQDFEVRKIHLEGRGPKSSGLCIPRRFVESLGIEKGTMVKLTVEGKRMMVEKLVLV